MTNAVKRIQGKEEGFTLVELLIVVAIIAILAAIAIPQFSAYRKRGYVATLNSDAINAYTAAMAYMADNPTGSSVCGGTVTSATAPGYQPSAGVTCTGTITAAGGSFTVSGLTAWGLTGNSSVVDNTGTFVTKAAP